MNKVYSGNLSKNMLHFHNFLRWESKLGHKQRDKCMAGCKREGMVREIISKGP